MDVKKSGIHGVKALVTLTLFALTIGAGSTPLLAQRVNTLLAAPVVSGTVTCATLTGPGAAQTITVKTTAALTSTATVTVTFVPVAGLNITPASVTLNAANTTVSASGASFQVVASAGCANLASGTNTPNAVQLKTVEVTPTLALGNDATATVNSTLSLNGSPLSASAITVNCSYRGNSVWAPQSSGTPVSVTSTVTTPFTISTATAWLSLSATSGTASSTATTFTAFSVSNCAGLTTPGSTASGSITLTILPTVTTTVNVTLVLSSPSPLTPTPSTISLSHVKGSGSAQTQSVSIASIPSGTYFTVNTATLPIWLTVNSTYAFAPASLTFSTTSVADTLAPGSYSATVYLQVFGQGDLPIAVSLFVTNAAPKLSISSANPLNITWVQGTAAPTATITAVSTDSPIPYSITTAGNLAPIVSASQLSGLAYSFGTGIAVTFPAQVYQTVQPGTVITGTVSLTWGSPATITTVTINLTVASPGATLTAISPATVPTAISTASSQTTYQIVLSGNGFVGGSNAALSTKVGIVAGGTVGGPLLSDTNVSVSTVLNPSSMLVTISVPSTADQLLPFSPTGQVINGQTVIGGQVTLGVCNGNCFNSVPTGTIVLNIGGGPVVQGVTSSSSFIEVTPPALPSIAPYDMISIFGENFCTSGGSGCGSNTVLSNSPAGATMSYGTTLSPDSVSSTQRLLSVNFVPHGLTTPVSPAPLLFATNGQINAMVPGGLTTGSEYDILVSFGYGSGATLLTSSAFPVSVVAADPGIFTIGADGQGGAAALENSNYSLITSTNPAGLRSGLGDSDWLQLYVTGLGVPANGAAYNSSTAACISPLTNGYLAALKALTGNNSLSTIDGAVIQPSLFTGDLAPCFANTGFVVTLGGVAITGTSNISTTPINYVGFVASTIAGLYQVNVKLPPSTSTFTTAAGTTITGVTGPVQLPLTITTAGGASSQTGVTLWVTPRLNVEAPTVLSGPVTVAWAGSCGSWTSSGTSTGTCVVANPAEATGSVHYAITSGVLPAGLSFDQTTGTISGTPSASSGGSYAVTVTATDSATPPVTGSVTFTLNITADLTPSASVAGPWASVYGAAGSTITTISATGGIAPYSYTLTSPSVTVTGLSVGASTGAVAITSALLAGTYPITVHVADSAGAPLTATTSYSANLVVALAMANSAPASVTHGTGSTVTTVTATGNAGTLVYTLDSTSLTNGFTINPATGAVAPTTVASGGSYTITVTATDSVTPATGTTAYGTGSTSVTFTLL